MKAQTARRNRVFIDPKKITKHSKNPRDHKTLKSFVAKDIPDETRALQRGIGMSNDDTYWFKGQVVTKELLEKLKNEKK